MKAAVRVGVWIASWREREFSKVETKKTRVESEEKRASSLHWQLAAKIFIKAISNI